MIYVILIRLLIFDDFGSQYHAAGARHCHKQKTWTREWNGWIRAWIDLVIDGAKEMRLAR
jgi:hypothetical protein